MAFQGENSNVKRSCRDQHYIQCVFEYLQHLGLMDTASTFRQECACLGYFVPPDDNNLENKLNYKLLKYFESKDENQFFEVLNSQNLEMNSSKVKKLVADIHIFFATASFPMEQNFSKSTSSRSNTQDMYKRSSSASSFNNPLVSSTRLSTLSSILRLSNFLESNCSKLREDPEFTPYFSLVNSPNPQHHQLLCQALQDSWTVNLKGRLLEFLWLQHPPQKVPDIVIYLSDNFGKTKDADTQDNFVQKIYDEEICCCYPSSPKKCDTNVYGIALKRGQHSEQSFGGIESDQQMTFEFKENESSFAPDKSKLSYQSQAVYNADLALFTRRQNKKVSNDESLNYSETHEECQRQYTQLKIKFSKLHSDYHNLIGVASELTGALEKTARGQQVDLRETLNICLQIFPELFAEHQQMKGRRNKGIKGRFSLRSTSWDWTLDITYIKKILQEGNVKTRLLLLQALRWVITKNFSQKREEIMNQYVDCDLLNLQGNVLLKCLLAPPGVITPHPLQQSAARLLNTLASVQSGRSYLAQNSETVNVTAAVVQQQDGILIDSITKSMLVAALQKLSLRRNQRIAMIQSGMVEWLFEHLSNIELDSSYSLEYGTALLMNLCLHESAKEICIPISQKVITVVINLLSTSVTQALPYINGILYSLVTHSVLNKNAEKLGFAKALEENIKKQENIEIRKQMEHILQYHRSSLDCKDVITIPSPVGEGEMMDEDKEELDLLGDELDERDPVRNIRGEMSGENLLRAHYTLSNQSHDDSEGAILSESETSVSQGTQLLWSPTTPHHTTQHASSSLVDSSWKISFNSFQKKTRTDNLNNNWYRRETEVTPENVSSRQIAEISPNKFENYETTVRSEHDGGDFTHPIQSHVADRTETNAVGRSFVVYQKDNQRTLPQIAIQVASSDDTYADKNDESDDSDDVQIGYMPGKNPCDSHPCSKTVNNLDLLHEGNEEKRFCGTRGSETSAFISRPKIPRTPPHS